MTLFGAIGTCIRDGFTYMTGSSTCITEFEQFVQQIQANLTIRGANDPLPYLVLDLHRAHTSLRLRETLAMYFRILWLPPQSCRFNSIEILWSYIKR